MFDRKAYMHDYNKEYKKEHKEDLRIMNNNWKKDKNKKNRLQVLSHYSPSLKCQCCGENHYEFLTIDHINGDGAKHRREI